MTEQTAKDQAYIHRFLPAASQPAPVTLFLLHGTGGNEEDLLGLGQLVAPEAARLSPRGDVLENGMPRFFRRLAEGIFDIPDLKARTHKLADFVISASKQYGLDPHRIVAVGYSNGANIAASMLLLRPDVLAGAILFHPMVPLVPEPLPDLSGKPVFIGAGRNDPIVPASNTEQLVHLLQQSGASVTTFWHPGGHAISREDVREAQRWWQVEGSKISNQS